jgi:hypothetical protein
MITPRHLFPRLREEADDKAFPAAGNAQRPVVARVVGYFLVTADPGDGILGVAGNYDLAVLSADAEAGRREYLNPEASEAGEQGYRWTRARVCAETRSFLLGLPAQLRIEEGIPTPEKAHPPGPTPDRRGRSRSNSSRKSSSFRQLAVAFGANGNAAGR